MSRILRSVSTYVALAIGLVGLGIILYAWRLPPFASAIEMTENAYVRGQVTIIAPRSYQPSIRDSSSSTFGSTSSHASK